MIMASDTISGPHAAAAAAHAIEERSVDLIVGTQLVAKGWHFPHLTFVGVVDADLGLAGGELRASERTVQLLHQVAGRAGRAEAAGRVMLQTFIPDHPVMQALLQSDLDAFMESEAESRRDGEWPPYGRLAALIVSADFSDHGRHGRPRSRLGGAPRRRHRGAGTGAGTDGPAARAAPPEAAAEGEAGCRGAAHSPRVARGGEGASGWTGGCGCGPNFVSVTYCRRSPPDF